MKTALLQHSRQRGHRCTADTNEMDVFLLIHFMFLARKFSHVFSALTRRVTPTLVTTSPPVPEFSLRLALRELRGWLALQTAK